MTEETCAERGKVHSAHPKTQQSSQGKARSHLTLRGLRLLGQCSTTEHFVRGSLSSKS